MSATVSFASRSGPQASICPPKRFGGRYRRSATTKAPRKRTFIANMTKYSERREHQAVASGAVSEAVSAYTAQCLFFGGGNDNGNGAGKPRFSRDENGGSDGSCGASMPLPLLVAAAFAVGVASLLALPQSVSAAPRSAPIDIPLAARGVATNGGSASGGRSLASASPRNGGLNATGADTKGASLGRAPSNETKIPFGRVSLSDDERKMLSDRRYNVRETLRIYN